MMWNFPGKINFKLDLFIGLLIFSLPFGCISAPATDSPAPALVSEVATPAQGISKPPPGKPSRVQLNRIKIQTIKADHPLVAKIIHPDNLPALRNPLLIEVHVDEPFSDLSRDASPVIVLNGQPLTNSIVGGENLNQIFAIVPDKRNLKNINSVQVGWFGDLKATISSPTSFSLDSLQ
ncbi:MAG: hypothetical protein IH886_10575 [Nitrospinae bacterium]|nr:hypothetical protein [Nitrospinota bacterium]